MPQMSPINWLTLFLIFSANFLIFNMMNYYLYNPCMTKPLTFNKNLNKFNWKW